MAVEITPPPRGVYAWRVPFRLDRVSGAALWKWNAINASWALSLVSPTGTLIAGPIPLVPGDDLLAQWRHFDVPPGVLQVESSVERPGKDDFGTVARLVYSAG